MQTCNPALKRSRSGVQGHPQLHRDFETSLRYMCPWFRGPEAKKEGMKEPDKIEETAATSLINQRTESLNAKEKILIMN